MRDDRAKLLDISEAIEKIDRYSGIGEDAFARDELIQTWMVYHLQIIGEAVTQLSEEFRAQHPDVPWRDRRDEAHPRPCLLPRGP